MDTNNLTPVECKWWLWFKDHPEYLKLSYEELASMQGLSINRVYQVMKSLKEKGFIIEEVKLAE